jgi:hypothetical protein
MFSSWSAILDVATTTQPPLCLSECDPTDRYRPNFIASAMQASESP